MFQTKICIDFNCELFGNPQPIENFTTGFAICKKCRAKKYKQKYLDKCGGVLTKPKALTDEERIERRRKTQKNANIKNKQKRNEWEKQKRKTDISFQITKNFSRRIRYLIKKKHKTVDILNYTTEDLIKHLENQFRPGMAWNNYGIVWEIDHIVPVSYFKFKSENDEEFKICWSLKNLQPLFILENRKKSNKM